VLSIKIDGLEEFVQEKIDQALAARTPEPDGWIDSKDAAAYLGITLASLHNLVSSGKLPRHGEPGTRLRFRREDLDAYVGRRS
jgi:excisionase family DNA binding protein